MTQVKIVKAIVVGLLLHGAHAIKGYIPYQLQQVGAAYQCTTAVQRAIAGPDDWTKVIGTGKQYEDPTFPADSSMIVWPGFQRADSAALSRYVPTITKFIRPSQWESNPSLWGKDGIESNDIV